MYECITVIILSAMLSRKFKQKLEKNTEWLIENSPTRFTALFVKINPRTNIRFSSYLYINSTTVTSKTSAFSLLISKGKDYVVIHL